MDREMFNRMFPVGTLFLSDKNPSKSLHFGRWKLFSDASCESLPKMEKGSRPKYAVYYQRTK